MDTWKVERLAKITRTWITETLATLVCDWPEEARAKLLAEFRTLAAVHPCENVRDSGETPEPPFSCSNPGGAP